MCLVDAIPLDEPAAVTNRVECEGDVLGAWLTTKNFIQQFRQGAAKLLMPVTKQGYCGITNIVSRLPERKLGPLADRWNFAFGPLPSHGARLPARTPDDDSAVEHNAAVLGSEPRKPGSCRNTYSVDTNVADVH